MSSTKALPLLSRSSATQTSFGVLIAISICHLLNDVMQSLIPALYPVFKDHFRLDFGQIGLISLSFNVTASLLQPAVGFYTDRRPKPYSLAFGMAFTFAGLLLLSIAPTYLALMGAASLVGLGSAIFHPESARVARIASGGKHGLAQSVFQVGGNVGSSLGPLLAAFIVLPRGQKSVAWFSLVALLGIAILTVVGRWYKKTAAAQAKLPVPAQDAPVGLPRKKVITAIGILVVLVFSKYIYLTSLSSYFTFFLIEKFGISVRSAQLHLFLFMGSVAAGTLIGGPVGDKIGRKYVIWCSILGILPFTLVLPYVDLFWTGVLVSIIGLILASAFSAIIVYAQELVPGKVGTISGIFFGFAFGLGGIGAAVLGQLADATSLRFVYQVCSFLPCLGLLTVFLPDTRPAKAPLEV